MYVTIVCSHAAETGTAVATVPFTPMAGAAAAAAAGAGAAPSATMLTEALYRAMSACCELSCFATCPVLSSVTSSASLVRSSVCGFPIVLICATSSWSTLSAPAWFSSFSRCCTISVCASSSSLLSDSTVRCSFSTRSPTVSWIICVASFTSRCRSDDTASAPLLDGSSIVLAAPSSGVTSRNPFSVRVPPIVTPRPSTFIIATPFDVNSTSSPSSVSGPRALTDKSSADSTAKLSPELTPTP
mmetsp:Transcript_420/g.1426  ORF Transcript_420/g.1426 Transcript_420/m.1426 type:complete len:243 (-) Transcript_420:201-929(-)